MMQYQLSLNLHNSIKVNMLKERDKIVELVLAAYEPYFRELDANF